MVETLEQAVEGGALGQEVPVGRVASALRDLWASNEAISKAALVNFAVYSEKRGSLAENNALIAEVTRDHACRAILMEVDAEADEPAVRAWITAHCQVTGTGGKSVCSEQIAFLITGKAAPLVRNTLFANLESDLPLVFFWQGDLTDRWEPHLFRRIDRLVVDSTQWSDPVAQYKALRAAWRDAAAHFVVLDVAWMRIFPFRQALAGAFDHALARHNLCHLQRITITHAPGHRVSAALLASWIAYKAGWHIDPGDLTLEEAPGAPLSSLVLGGDRCRLEITRQPGGAFLHGRMTTADGSAALMTPATEDDLATLVSERLSRGGNTQLYFKLWRQARPWLAQTTVPA